MTTVLIIVGAIIFIVLCLWAGVNPFGILFDIMMIFFGGGGNSSGSSSGSGFGGGDNSGGGASSDL